MSKWIEIRCGECLNDFAYHPEEVKEKDGKKYVECPICHNKTYI